jgi:hypothetical protein
VAVLAGVFWHFPFSCWSREVHFLFLWPVEAEEDFSIRDDSGAAITAALTSQESGAYPSR